MKAVSFATRLALDVPIIEINAPLICHKNALFQSNQWMQRYRLKWALFFVFVICLCFSMVFAVRDLVHGDYISPMLTASGNLC